MKVTEAQQRALDKLEAEGVIYPGNGVSVATVAALAAQDLAELVHLPSSHHYGSLGSRGGTARGYWVRNWIARPMGFAKFAEAYADNDIATRAWRERKQS